MTFVAAAAYRGRVPRPLAALLVLVAMAAPGSAVPPRPAEPVTRQDKRPGEPSPEPRRYRLDEEELPLHLDLKASVVGLCHVRGYGELRRRLLALDNATQYMSLEVWGDAEQYGPYQTVLFHVRVPRTAYVTLFWLGPEGHITVPVDNVRVPPERNVSIDTGGIVVPPYGEEKWVAIATMEPFPVSCGPEPGMLASLERRLKALHGVGRWEVKSLEQP